MNELLRLVASALKLSVGDIDPGMTMKTTAAWDSLAHMELVISIEEHYQIVFDGDQIADMTSLAAIIGLLRQKGLLDGA